MGAPVQSSDETRLPNSGQSTGGIIGKRTSFAGIGELLVHTTACIFLGAFTFISGIHGIYIFDMGIVSLMGWLIHNGWKPFIDFLTPVPPMSGIMVSTGFSLFGLNHISAIIISSVLTVFLYLFLFFLLQRHLPFLLNALFSVALSLSALPIFCFPFYNHLVNYFLAAFSASAIVYFHSTDRISIRSSLFAGIIYSLGFMLLLTKMQNGLLTLASFLLTDMLMVKSLAKGRQLSLFVHICLRLVFIVIPAIITIIWLNCDFGSIFTNLFTTAETDGLRKNLIMRFREYSLFARDTGFFSITIDFIPRINILLFVIFYAAFLLSALFKKHEPRASAGGAFPALLFGVFFCSSQLMLSTITTETFSIDLTAEIIILLAIAFGTKYITGEPKNAVIFIAPIVFWLAIFTVFYIHTGVRKSYSETDEKFSAHGNYMSLYESVNPFFAGTTIRVEQKEVLDYIYNLELLNPDRHIFYGGELEMMYPATRRLPPKGWPLWLHTDVSVNKRDFPRLKSIFDDEMYDIVILSRNRLWMTEFLDCSFRNDYENVFVPSYVKWIYVLKRKSAEILTP